MIIRIATSGDNRLFDHVAEGVFDCEIDSAHLAEFLSDPRHHIAVAVEHSTIVGFVSAVHYVHPDKATELWINEVAVAPSHQNRGIGKQLMHAMLEHGRSLGCLQAWVLTDRDNAPAMKLYASAGGTEMPPDSVMFEFKLRPSP